MKSFSFILILVFMLGCSKTQDENEFSTKSSTTEKNSEPIDIKKTVLSTDTTNQLIRIELSNTNLRDFFLSYDTSILRSFKEITAERISGLNSNETNLEYMINKNSQLIAILENKNATSYSGMNPTDDIVLIAGLFELYYEVENSQNFVDRAPIPWACIRTVIEGIVTGSSIISSYKAMIASGASWAGVRAFLLQSLKRYGGWMLAAGALYDIATNCF